ncbi:MAG: hypothetical protein U0736_21095 [Gemmataceae bacterium]
MSLRTLATGLVLALAVWNAGCSSCCHHKRPASPPCCPPGPAVVAPPPPPPSTAGFPPATGLPAAYVR